MIKKYCGKCNLSKSLSQFYKSSSTGDGFQTRCKDCHRVYSRLYERKLRKTNPEKLRERAERFAKNNPYKYKEYAKSERQRIRRQVLDGYGHKCACCGEDEYKFLALDHVNGGGNQLRKKTKGNSLLHYRDAIHRNFPKDYQLLCHNCNLAKGFYGKCPHND